MSLRGKEVRPLIDAELHEKLVVMAAAHGEGTGEIAKLAARLLEKMIAAEWHEFSLTLRRAERLGKRWKAVEGDGR